MHCLKKKFLMVVMMLVLSSILSGLHPLPTLALSIEWRPQVSHHAVPLPVTQSHTLKLHAAEKKSQEGFYTKHFEKKPHLALEHFIHQVNPKLTSLECHQLAQHILYYSSQFRVDYRLIASVVATESSFRSDALSYTGAMGLGQLKPQTASWLGVKEPFQVQDNLQGTTRYLQYLLTRFNTALDPALASYFEGPTKVSRQGISPQGVAYLHRINKHLQHLKRCHQPWRALPVAGFRRGDPSS